MKNKGFTLVEMLIVIIILGVLLILVIPNLTGLVADQKEKSLKIHLDNVEQATKLYIVKNRGTVLSGNSYTLNYQTLINQRYIDEDDIICCGEIVISVANDHSDYKDIVYNLRCVNDKKEDTSKKDSTCSNFNRNF